MRKTGGTFVMLDESMKQTQPWLYAIEKDGNKSNQMKNMMNK